MNERGCIWRHGELSVVGFQRVSEFHHQPRAISVSEIEKGGGQIGGATKEAVMVGIRSGQACFAITTGPASYPYTQPLGVSDNPKNRPRHTTRAELLGLIV